MEPTNNVNPAAKRRKITEKKTPLPNGMNIKTMFIKILSRQETNDQIEIDSD